MGITIHYKALPRTLEEGETIEDLRLTLERVAMDSAITWAGLLGLSKPVLEKSKVRAWVHVDDESEPFELWQNEKRPYDDDHYLWRGFTKTQYANPLVHVQVAMICKDLIRSGLFERGFISLTDEADFFGDWFDIGGMVGAVLENAAVINSVAQSLKGLGWEWEEKDSASSELIMKGVENIIHAGLDELDLLVYEKAKSITDLELFKTAAKVSSDRIAKNRGYEYDMSEPLLKRLQKDLVLFLYEYSEDEIKAMPEDAILQYAMTKFDMRAVEWKIAPIFSEVQ